MSPKCTDCNGKDKLEYKTILHEPIAPYYSGSYSTLISVVNGLALGAIFFVIAEKEILTTNGNVDFLNAWQCFIAFGVICTLWHSYIGHIQYLAWPIGFFDTLIPMTFSASIALLALSIGNIKYFTLVFTLIIFCGFIAFWNANNKISHKTTAKVYKEHFQGASDNFSDCILQHIKKREVKSRNLYFVISIYFYYLTLVIFKLNPLKEDHDNGAIFVCVSCTIVMIILILSVDLRRHLKKMTCLKQLN